MVLQRQQANRVWGKASPGEAITVSLNDQSHDTVADDSGSWSVELDSMEAGGPFTLSVKGENEITIDDVLVGEVWICSGQSNMEWSIDRSYDADLVKLMAENHQIRMINYPNVGKQEPVFSHSGSRWQLASAQHVGSFSAVGYYFGKTLQKVLGVPVGLVNDAWGGSACEAWIPREKLADGQYDSLLADWAKTEADYQTLKEKSNLSDDEKKQLANLSNRLSGNARPANIYNGVLKSHLGYGIRGAIWYQGESNASRAEQYRELFPLMISTWREEWGQGDFPFYWVQLADFQDERSEPADSDWAELREAQTMTLDKLPATGQAVIIDVGEGRDIHPRDKQTVGHRLARLALANDYGYDIAHRSPRFKSMNAQDGKATLEFEHVDGGLQTFDVKEARGFAIAGDDRRWVWADAKLVEGNRIEVSSPKVPHPVAVRYGWADNPVVNVYDGTHLPLTPFRTDDW